MDKILEIQTKLNKSKAFVDNESFAFLFRNAKPLAIHKDQLFKNQIYNETIASDGHINYTRLNPSKLKTEKISDIQLFNSGKQYGIVLDSGDFVFSDPNTVLSESNFKRLSAPNITVNGNIYKDKIVKFITNDTSYGVFLTANNKIYYANNIYNTTNWKSTTLSNVNISQLEGTVIDIWYAYYNTNFVPLALTSKGYLYSLNKFVDSTEVSVIGTNWANIKDIKSYDNKTFIIMKNGKCYANGSVTDGTLGLGGSYNSPDSFTEVCSKFTATSVDEEDVLNNLEVEDVGIGKSHTVFLLKNGTAIGFGSNTYHQLAKEGEVFTDKFAVLSSNFGLKEVKCTDYGTIFSTYEGKILYTGVFVKGELGVYTKNETVYALKADGTPDTSKVISSPITITVDNNNYTKFLKSDFLTEIYDSTVIQQPFFLKLFNNITPLSLVMIVKEDKNIYLSGTSGTKLFSVSTKLNDSFRSESTNKLRYWSYFKDVISKIDTHGGDLYRVLFKDSNGNWIDWNAYFNKYKNITLRDPNNTNNNTNKLDKLETIYDENGDKLDTHFNIDSFSNYIKYNSSSIEAEFGVKKNIIPELEYIDKDRNIWKINAGDNISMKYYTENDFNNDTKTLNEKVDYYDTEISRYNILLEKTEDIDEITTYQDTISELKTSKKEVENQISIYKNKIGSINDASYFDYPSINIITPNEIIDSEKNKSTTYTRTVFGEPDSITGISSVQTKTIDGATSVVSESKTVTSDNYITRIQPKFVNLDHIKDPENNAETINNKDDIEFTINNKDGESYSFSNILLWMSGRFINKDYFTNDDFTSFVCQKAKSLLDVRRISEYPGLGEPKSGNSSVIPYIYGDTATVIEPTIPTELRWDIDLRAFSWDRVNIDGPYRIHNADIKSELSGYEAFYFGDVYVSVFTKIRLLYRRCEKGTFLLFYNGMIVSNKDYAVSYDSNSNTSTIELHTYSKFVSNLLQEQINIREPGYAGHIRHLMESINDGSQFSIAFLSTDEEYKKVKLYYDRENLRNYPNIGNVSFRDISYNDLITFDGSYVPYLWKSKNVIEIPQTTYNTYTSENDFMDSADIVRIRPYITYKTVDELTATEVKEFALENKLVDENESDITVIRAEAKKLLDKLIKDC